MLERVYVQHATMCACVFKLLHALSVLAAAAICVREHTGSAAAVLPSELLVPQLLSQLDCGPSALGASAALSVAGDC